MWTWWVGGIEMEGVGLPVCEVWAVAVSRRLGEVGELLLWWTAFVDGRIAAERGLAASLRRQLDFHVSAGGVQVRLKSGEVWFSGWGSYAWEQ